MADTKSDESSKSNLPMTHRVLAGDGYVLANQAQDSSHLLSDPIALNKALDTDGVLYLSGFLDRLTILSARQYILKLFESEGFLLPGSDRMSAIRNPETVQNAGPSLLRRQDIACAPPVMDVLEHSRLSELSRLLLNAESVRTTKYKWLRAVQRGLFTGLHIDRSYFQKENNKILTIWIPFGDIPIEQGTLLWCPGSHRDARYEDVRLKYGSVDLGGDGTHSGWICSDPNILESSVGKMQWVTTDFAAGDVCVFGTDVIHMSTTNRTEAFRISCDTRWIDSSEQKEDV